MIRFRKTITAGRPYDLVVSFPAAKLDLPTGRASVSFVVVVTAPGFTVQPEVEQWIEVKPGAREAKVTYSLTALEPGQVKMTRDIRAAIWRDNVAIATETFQTTVVPSAAEVRRGSKAASKTIAGNKPRPSPPSIRDPGEAARRTVGNRRRPVVAKVGTGNVRRGQVKARARRNIVDAPGTRTPSRGVRRSVESFGGAGAPDALRGATGGRRRGVMKNGGGGRHSAPTHRMVAKSRARKSVSRARSRASTTKPALSVSREPSILFHELVEAGKPNDLVVNLSDAISHAERERVVVDIEEGEDSVNVEVRLSAPGFTVKPKPEKTIKVGRVFDAKKEQATFSLTATDPGPKPLTREIRTDFWLGNTCVGAVTHRTTVIAKGYRGPAAGDGTGRSTPFVLDEKRQECDLVIFVTSTKEDGKPPYNIHFQSEIPGADYPYKSMGRLSITPKELTKTLNGVFSQFVSAFPVGGTKKQVAEWRENMRDAIEKLGKYLWGKLPAKFRDEYFRLKDGKHLPVSIQVHSDEMLIPWELLIPHRSNGKTEVLKPLGMMHVMGRWRPGLGVQPRPQRMRVQSASIVNPKYPGNAELWWSVLEASELKKKWKVFEPLEPATRKEFKKLLDRSNVQLVHYTGHGKYTAKQADLSSLALQGGDMVDAIDFVAANLLSKGKPLVYLNACEAGNVGVAMGQMGGFAVQCLDHGCSGVIAPYWAVVDGTAKDFSLAFYEMLKNGHSIGEALKQLRAKNPKDPTFQAFSYFGDPWTQVF